jgi:hypothetical protein
VSIDTFLVPSLVPRVITTTRGVCDIVSLPFTLKSILRQKKIYGNLKFSTCKNIIFKKKSSKRNQNPSRYYYNSIITNLKFQHKPKNIIFKKSSYKNRPIIIYYLGAKIP